MISKRTLARRAFLGIETHDQGIYAPTIHFDENTRTNEIRERVAERMARKNEAMRAISDQLGNNYGTTAHYHALKNAGLLI